jgi:hypothetical protein
VAELVDAQDLKSCLPKGEYGFDSRLGDLIKLVMRQPKVVRILDCSEKRTFNLPDVDFKCRIQKREAGDDSKVIYVKNPCFNEEETSTEESQYLALCEGEYEVVEWTKK